MLSILNKMYVVEYLKHWWMLRPQRMKNYDSLQQGDYRNKYGNTIYTSAVAYEDLIKVLALKHRPIVYIEGKLEFSFGQPCGLHTYRRLHPVIYLAYTECDLLFNLAHEMYHQYQHEQYPKKFKCMSQEEREIEAQGFAVAFCEHKGMQVAAKDRCIFLPSNVGHIDFSAIVNYNTVTEQATDNRTIVIPKAVRLKADAFKNFFKLD